MGKLTSNEVCKAFSISKTTLTNWINRGCPHEQTAKGKLFVLAEVIKWHQEKFLKTESSDTEGLTKARAMKEHFRALLAELEFKEKNGELVPAKDVKDAAFLKARQIRDGLLIIPNRISDLLAGEINAAGRIDKTRVHEILGKELRQALENLSNNLNRPEVKNDDKN
ncbi:MAG: hypothetical protein UZ01_03290 [Candidatus Brocadia sinica]|nr:MAG: hypothetical protein UZ01_03290 [Candidatus Brocadia sinica]